MCGVGVVVGQCREQVERVADQLRQVLSARGPDHVAAVVYEMPSGLTVAVVASVLWIRGAAMAAQPIERPEGVLAWNGELYNRECLENADGSDSLQLLAWLIAEGPAAFVRCEGPFAITFLDRVRNCLLFGRNRFGQRSLLVALPSSLPGERITHEPDHALGQGSFELGEDGVVILTSVVPPALRRQHVWREVPVTGVFELDLSDKRIMTLRQTLAFTALPRLRMAEGTREEVNTRVLKLLRASVRKRVATLGRAQRMRLLFSGGIDCLLLAALLHEALSPHSELVLRNVAFGEAAECDAAFDRVQARRAFEELKQLFPERKWMLEETSVGHEELKEALAQVEQLTFPQTSVMDVTIGSVLWFAFSGSDCKVVFTGIGADELFAGYARHRARFDRAGGSWQVLGDELLCEVERIGYRNNGRDDRLCGSFGKEARHPFLDEELCHYALSCPLHSLVDFEDPSKEGGKTALRSALQSLGFSRAMWNCPKKAMQFGSRVTKTPTFRHTRRGSEEFHVKFE
jgi:asparagine synthetase B (glutamine-hydrolysing)